jgi:hypothetical protein
LNGRIYIVEGVAGSGKDKLVQSLVSAFRPEKRRVYSFTEEAVLASWVHYRLPDIHELRLSLARSLVERLLGELREDQEVTYVFNRFHVSYAVWRWESGLADAYRSRHDELVDLLRRSQVRILHAFLDPEIIEVRSGHRERQDLAWREFLEWRTRHFGFATPGASYIAQQAEMQRVLDADGLPYRTVRVNADPSLPVPYADLWLDDEPR